jgi:DNA-binding transcriptional MerR regulator
MMQRLTQEQLKQIITEVEGLKLLREEGLDQEQVKEILQELNLPPELLDEALIQLRRREVLAVRQRRNQWIVAFLGVTVAVAIASIIFFMEQHNSAISRVSVQQDRIATVQDDGGNVKTISRQPNLKLFYQVTPKFFRQKTAFTPKLPQKSSLVNSVEQSKEDV